MTRSTTTGCCSGVLLACACHGAEFSCGAHFSLSVTSAKVIYPSLCLSTGLHDSNFSALSIRIWQPIHGNNVRTHIILIPCRGLGRRLQDPHMWPAPSTCSGVGTPFLQVGDVRYHTSSARGELHAAIRAALRDSAGRIGFRGLLHVVSRRCGRRRRLAGTVPR
jgi:hypothetical protein